MMLTQETDSKPLQVSRCFHVNNLSSKSIVDFCSRYMINLLLWCFSLPSPPPFWDERSTFLEDDSIIITHTYRGSMGLRTRLVIWRMRTHWSKIRNSNTKNLKRDNYLHRGHLNVCVYLYRIVSYICRNINDL